ncbi:MAG: tetratricopeptide repeat protein [Chitinophagales bacterium]|nr:tetratricopeptide repeat protein [Chitinophagales bacterium]
MNSKILFISILFVLFSSIVAAQPTKKDQKMLQQQTDMSLAQQYFQNGDFEKASLLYATLYEDSPKNNFLYRQYVKSLMGMHQYEEAEKIVRRQMKNNKNDVSLLMDLGLIYKETEQADKATEQFEEAVKNARQEDIGNLGNLFTNNNLSNYAIAIYKKGRQLNNDPLSYAYELALAYQREGDTENLISSFLDYAEKTPEQVGTVYYNLQKVVATEAGMEALQSQLYARIQEKQDEIIFIEILAWALKQQKDFEGAMVQVKALDRRRNEDGKRIMELAQQAFTEKLYDVAIDGYEYIIGKGTDNRYYVPAKVELLHVRNEKVTESDNYTTEDINNLLNDYQTFFNLLGKNTGTVNALYEMSVLYAYYLNDLDKAIAVAQEVVDMPNVDNRVKGKAKLSLGDYYLMKNEVWEATLLYSQVDKMFKDDILGEEARFRNAKLSYFNGEFDWAQSQLDILKASTSELISNDAIELSTFIIENLGLDTTANTMEMYARAELLIAQNQYPQALATLDSIQQLYPDHVLADDILMTRSKIAIKKRDYKTAENYLNTIIEKYKDGILVDNSLFMLGELYERQFNNPQKAMEYYQDILLTQAGSLFMAEARKRYRKLRGDKVY